MAGSLKKMLKENQQREDIPLWITETGGQAPIKPDAAKDRRQADLMIKTFVLPLAQGFERVFWFESRGPAYGKGMDHGIIRQDWSLRPSYHALKTMTSLLGPVPEYIGWLNVGGNGFGFVFNGAEGRPVLVTWAVNGRKPNPAFTTETRVISADGNESALKAGEKLSLGREAVFVTGISGDLVNEARSNLGQPYPWGGDFKTKGEVKIQLGASNIGEGMEMKNPETTDVVQGLDWSARRSRNSKGGEGPYAYFRTDPTFAGFGDKKIEVTVVARRDKPSNAADMTITYEGLKGYTSARERFIMPEGEGWSEHTWKLTDANFVGAWGWNLRTDASGSPGEFQIREVRVRKVP